MKIIIVGAGEIGRHLAVSLAREAHSIVVIEHDVKVAEELEQQIDGRVLTGNGATANLLLEAGVAECELLEGGGGRQESHVGSARAPGRIVHVLCSKCSNEHNSILRSI